jgi:hypothetical protein
MSAVAHDAPHTVVGRLEEIERDLAERMNDYEQAADDRARKIRDWEKRLAIHQKTANGANAEVRKATALVAAIEQDGLYEELSDAEARYDALRVVVRVLETRATIGMSILRSQGRA